ncbi:MAG: hypothetical protein KKC68_03520 [Candidatus Thermoplasmatota archaeon]|nr:hypothetical protein [Candidatus Thermoplasmatota archaeon]MBU1940823.1 hypothetical protein [Candidatus Thermoplasmatota archaeon]
MNYKKTLEDLQKLLDELITENHHISIIVEGTKDKTALQQLGITGSIITINKGQSLTNFCDQLTQHYHHLILLTDWDRKGGHILRILRKNLEGRITMNLEYRRAIAQLSLIRTVEGLPSYLNTLKTKVLEEKSQ